MSEGDAAIVVAVVGGLVLVVGVVMRLSRWRRCPRCGARALTPWACPACGDDPYEDRDP